MLAVLIAGYAAAVLATRDQWTAGEGVPGTAVTFRATAPEGSTPTSEELDQTQEVLNERIAASEVQNGSVDSDGDLFTVTVPGDGNDVRDLAGTGGRFDLRPVVHSIPSQSTSGTSPAPAPPGPPDPANVEDEKQLRQSTDQSIQILALQFQATRCGQADVLAGRDDPNLPLVTCSQDGTEVYLLDEPILTGADIADATSERSEAAGEYVVDLEFTEAAAQTWAEFTAANIGSQAAFVLDTAVVSAPAIQEAIPDGKTQITGQFTDDSAPELAEVLKSGALPLTLEFESADPVTLPGEQASTPLRIGLVAAGAILLLTVVGTSIYLVMTRRRSR